MNPDFRKVALIAASLGLLVSLFFALRPKDDDGDAAPATSAEATAPATTEAPPATTEPPPETTTAATTAQGPGTVRIGYTITGGVPEGGIARTRSHAAGSSSSPSTPTSPTRCTCTATT